MNNDLFHCYPLNNIPQFQENSSAQQRYSHSSFHELILNCAAITASWAPLEQQDYSSARSSTLEHSIALNPRRIITPPPPPPNCYEQQQHVGARNHPSNQYPQEKYSFSLKNDEYSTTRDTGHAVDSSSGALFEQQHRHEQVLSNGETTDESTPIFPENHDIMTRRFNNKKI
jgi:hypothetical protein